MNLGTSLEVFKIYIGIDSVSKIIVDVYCFAAEFASSHQESIHLFRYVFLFLCTTSYGCCT